MATIRVNTSGWQRGLIQLRERAPQACVRSLNRAATSGRVVMLREVAGDMGLRQGDIAPKITIEQARPSNLRAAVIGAGVRIRLIKFKAQDRRPRGVTARLKGGAGRYPHAFIATVRGRHQGVFQRVGSGRLPITQLHGPSVPKVFTEHINSGLDRAEASLIKNLTHEMRWLSQ